MSYQHLTKCIPVALGYFHDLIQVKSESVPEVLCFRALIPKSWVFFFFSLTLKQYSTTLELLLVSTTGCLYNCYGVGQLYKQAGNRQREPGRFFASCSLSSCCAHKELLANQSENSRVGGASVVIPFQGETYSKTWILEEESLPHFLEQSFQARASSTHTVQG